MARARWQAGAIIRTQLADGWYYGRLLAIPWAAFYRYRTEEPSDDLDAITHNEVIFTVTVHRDLLAQGQWRPIGRKPLEPELQPPAAQAIRESSGCMIMTPDGMLRVATREECEGLEPAAFWEPEHIADRVMDSFAGRENHWLRELMQRGA